MGRLETIRAKMLRRACLAVLRAAQEAGGDGWTFARSAFDFLAPEFSAPELSLREVEEALRYVAGKGYAQVRTIQDSKFVAGRMQARISPAGIDLLEETVPADPGVEDNRI